MADEPATTAEDDLTAEQLAAGIDRATGFATDGELPINSRLRAEALVRRGDKSDAGGLVSDDLIADTADRLAREDAETERQRKAEPSLKWSRDDLLAEATRREATFEADANKSALLDAINAAPAATITEV